MGKKVIVVGAGAAGILAAIRAANRGAAVTLLEAMDKPGHKLLLTGNGRCNLTNMDPDLFKRYYGSGRESAAYLTDVFDAVELRDYFHSIGLLTREREGYVYPVTNQSVTVLNVLLAELRARKVKLKCQEYVQNIFYQDDQWQVQTKTWTYQADRVILTCGSCVAPATGSDGNGYVLAKKLKLQVVPPVPALVPVECRGEYFVKAAGVRCPAEVSLYRIDQQEIRIAQERGELQWTKYGLSGIVIFQLSRFISSEREKQFSFHINFLPDYTPEYVIDLLEKRAKDIPTERISVLLSGLLHEKLIPILFKQAGIKEKMICKELSKAQLDRLVYMLFHFSVPVIRTKDFDLAQVCAGGISGKEWNPKTMEAKKHPGLYFAGEILDVDGPCGGYNLQWAWSSGWTAGTMAATS